MWCVYINSINPKYRLELYKNNDARFFDTYNGVTNHHYKVKGFVLRLKILDIVASGGSIGTPTTLLRRILNMKYKVSRQLLWYYLSSLERDGLIFIDRRTGKMDYLTFIPLLLRRVWLGSLGVRSCSVLVRRFGVKKSAMRLVHGLCGVGGSQI